MTEPNEHVRSREVAVELVHDSVDTSSPSAADSDEDRARQVTATNRSRAQTRARRQGVEHARDSSGSPTPTLPQNAATPARRARSERLPREEDREGSEEAG